MIKLGLDFDNTIITYDEIFYKIALERNLITENCIPQKNVIRDFLILKNLEDQFTLLQAEVYGKRILEARPAENVLENLLNLKKIKNVQYYIVSHKTKKPIKGPNYDLHEAAINWLLNNDFFSPNGLNLKRENIYFEPTKQSKIERIKMIDCSHYIDDLTDILNMIENSCIKILYNPFNVKYQNKNWINLVNWNDLDKIFI